jgi:hypothetical protein
MATGQSQNFWSWLGRQVGHVRKAVRTDVNGGGAAEAPAPEKIVFRQGRVEEKPMPDDPTLKLRRTTIDEVIAEKPAPPKDSC